jgi:hypothetical protein
MTDATTTPWWQDANHLRTQAAAMYREQFPAGCELCGEPADAEMGEFWDEAKDRGVIAHTQCGIDAELPLA